MKKQNGELIQVKSRTSGETWSVRYEFFRPLPKYINNRAARYLSPTGRTTHQNHKSDVSSATGTTPSPGGANGV